MQPIRHPLISGRGAGVRGAAARSLLAGDAAGSDAVDGDPGGAGEQPERRDGVGLVPGGVHVGGGGAGGGGLAGGAVSGDLGAAGALSDRAGRRWMIAGGMAIQAAGIWVVAAAEQIAAPVAWFAAGQALLGLGTAMVYPTLLAVIGDMAHPGWRAEAVGCIASNRATTCGAIRQSRHYGAAVPRPIATASLDTLVATI